MHLIRIPKEGLALQLPVSPHGKGHIYLKILQTITKTWPHQEILEKMCVGDNFLPNHTVLGCQRAESWPSFSECPRVCPESYALLLSALGCPGMRWYA